MAAAETLDTLPYEPDRIEIPDSQPAPYSPEKTPHERRAEYQNVPEHMIKSKEHGKETTESKGTSDIAETSDAKKASKSKEEAKTNEASDAKKDEAAKVCQEAPASTKPAETKMNTDVQEFTASEDEARISCFGLIEV